MARSVWGLVCRLLALLLALPSPGWASGYPEALKQFVPPSAPQEVEQALREGWLPQLAGHIDLNRVALDTARRAGGSKLALSDDPAALAALGRSLALRGVRRATRDADQGLEDLLAALRLGEGLCSQADPRWLSEGLSLERSAWRGYLTWLRVAPAEALPAADAALRGLSPDRDALLRLVAADLAQAQKQVLEFSQNPDGAPDTETLGLLRRLRSHQREDTYNRFADEAATYERMVRQAVETGNTAEPEKYLKGLRAKLAGRKGLRRVVVPSPQELAKLLAAERFRSYTDLVTAHLWTEAYWRAAPFLTRALSGYFQEGTWPETPPPLDPFGGSMVEIAQGNRLSLYSRGPDRTDSGGDHDLESLQAVSGRDITFRVEVQDVDEP